MLLHLLWHPQDNPGVPSTQILLLDTGHPLLQLILPVSGNHGAKILQDLHLEWPTPPKPTLIFIMTTLSQRSFLQEMAHSPSIGASPNQCWEDGGNI
jgi:hypothetical protein